MEAMTAWRRSPRQRRAATREGREGAVHEAHLLAGDLFVVLAGPRRGQSREVFHGLWRSGAQPAMEVDDGKLVLGSVLRRGGGVLA